MYSVKLLLVGFFLAVLVPISGFGQDGWQVLSSWGSEEATAGQIVNDFNDNGTIVVSSGFQYPLDDETGVAIEETVHEPLPGLDIYPNPTRGFVHIRSQGENLKGLQLRLIDPQGRVLKTVDPTGFEVSFDLSQVAAGVYLIQAIRIKDGAVQVARIIKQ